MLNNIKKRIWIIGVFSIIVALCIYLVAWLSMSTFQKNYSDIKMQHSLLINTQIVAEMETSIKNGKELERYYGIDKFLSDSAALYQVNTQIAVTDANGNIIASTFEKDKNSDDYKNLIAKCNIFSVHDQQVKIQNDSTVMIHPIKDANGKTVGNLVTLCKSSDLTVGLEQTTKYIYNTSGILALGAITLIILFLIVLKDKNENSNGKKSISLIKIVPVLILLLSILIQSTVMYNTFYKQYREAMFQGASSITDYIGNVIENVHEKGVQYNQMYGLSEYLANKTNESQILWSVKMDQVIADSSDVLKRDSEFNISKILDKSSQISIDIEISKDYIDSKMLSMALLFLVTLLTSIIMILEIIKFPAQLSFRNSKEYGKRSDSQYKNITILLRICTFLFFVSVYLSLPFSSLLVRQWNTTIFNLPMDIVVSLPITMELFAMMIGSLIFEKFIKKINLNLILICFSGLFIIANLGCFFINSLLELIFLRFLAGIGSSGVKYILNNIVSYGSDENKYTKENLGAINSGVLAGITAGASLGGVIATTLGVKISFVFTVGIAVAFLLLSLYLFPWRILNEQRKCVIEADTSNEKERVKSKYNFSIFKYLLFIMVPFNMGIMFIVTYMPNFIEKENLGSITLSICYLINGIAGIYFSSYLVDFAKRFNRVLVISMVPILGGISILVLNFEPVIVMVIVASVLLGLFDGYAAATSFSGFLEIDIVDKTWERSHALTVASSVGSGIQTISPVIYGALLSMANVSSGTVLLGGIFCIFGILYFLTSIGNLKKIK